MAIYVVGHLNPDTDAVVSAIALSSLEQSSKENYIPCVANEINRETDYVLKKFGFSVPQLVPKEKNKRVILVDHNEPNQLSPNIESEEIIGIFDHHKLGGPQTKKPIAVNMQPVGSTSTIIARIFGMKKIQPTRQIASLLIAGIVSYTINLTSPNTRDEDREAFEILNKTAGIDIDALADEMFKAKSDITGIPIKELAFKDSKIFDLKGQKVRVGVWETIIPDPVIEKKDEIIQALNSKKAEEEIELSFFFIVDLLNNNSVAVIASKKEEEIIKKVFNVQIKDELSGKLKGIVSRKSQMVPPIEGAL